MCCCIFFFFSLDVKNQFLLFFFFFTFDFQTWHIFTFSLPLFSPPFSFFPLCFPSFPPLVLYSLSLSLFPLSMFLLTCLVLDIGVVDHVNIFVPTCVHFGVVGVVLSPPSSHSGLFICDMHFGITHLVPHHCVPALIVLQGGGNSHHNCRGELAFLWPGCLSGRFHSLKMSMTDVSLLLVRKGCCVASEQTRQTRWTKGSGKSSASHRFTLLSISTASHQH